MTNLPDPGKWEMRPCRHVHGKPPEGALIAWRYAVWRIESAADIPDHDLTEKEATFLNQRPEFTREVIHPYRVVLRHERGPVMVDPARPEPDGGVLVHARIPPGGMVVWRVVAERYPVCSCHGHPWPCREEDLDQYARREAERAEDMLKRHAPGVCFHCGKPITSRQKSLTFPEPSPLAPIETGPSFHLRERCWSGAAEYEVEHRLPANPGVERLASCPGTPFWHTDGRVDCSTGPSCTNLHAPPGARTGVRRHACTTQVSMSTLGEQVVVVRPWSRCAAPGCTGAGDDTEWVPGSASGQNRDET